MEEEAKKEEAEEGDTVRNQSDDAIVETVNSCGSNATTLIDSDTQKSRLQLLKQQPMSSLITPGMTANPSLLPTQLVTAKYLHDHYSLLVPSSNVRFRGTTRDTFESHGCHVIESEDHQIILEEHLEVSGLDGSQEQPLHARRIVQVKRVRNMTKGLQFLRALYTIVCVLFVGIFLAFAIQLILNIVLDLAVISGVTHQESSAEWWHAPPLLFGLAQLCVTFAEGMVIATRFVIDAWSGHYMVRAFFPVFPGMRQNLVVVDWLFFFFLLGLPLTVMIITLFTGIANCWVITGVTWFVSVSIFFIAFASYTVFYEVRGAIQFVMRHSYPEHRCSQIFRHDNFRQACRRCILMRQVRRYSGKMRTSYFAKTLLDQNHEDPLARHESNDRVLGKDEVDIVEGSYIERMSVWSKISMWNLMTDKLHWFHRLEHPKKLFNVNDAQGLRPFVTKWTWSLERIYCNPASKRSIAIIDGPGAVTRNQVLSSVACSILGTVMITLLIISFLVWFGFAPLIIILMLLLLVVLDYYNVKRIRRNVSTVFEINKHKKEFQADDRFTAWLVNADNQNDERGDVEEPDGGKNDPAGRTDENAVHAKEGPSSKGAKRPNRQTFMKRRSSSYIDGPSIGLYIVGNHMRVTEASESICWFLMFWEIVLFFIWPIVVLYLLGQPIVGSIYFVSVGISLLRHYFNIVSVIEETGTMNLAPNKSKSTSWARQARLTDIVDKISTDDSKRAWLTILGVLGLIFVFLLFSGILDSDTSDTGDTTTLTYLPEWYYRPQLESTQYPSCVFGKPPSPALENYTLADMTFLSSLSYRSTSIIDSQLAGWFGPSGWNVTDEFDYVSDWKVKAGSGAKAAVFRLFRFPNENGAVGIVSVRGTANSLDLLVDNQLWQAAMLAQLVRTALPFGDIFTPILPTLVKGINAMQQEGFRRVSYYETVTTFVENLMANTTYTGFGLTGHSLGGGIAIISGAQTGVGAVAVSGPNAMLSRLSFKPRLTVEQLNTKTFNIIPHRDLIPRFDDVAQNYQNIECRSTSRNPLSCHSVIRTLCELMYTCGTQDRPALCECVTSFNFPMPLTDGDQDFDEICQNASALS